MIGFAFLGSHEATDLWDWCRFSQTHGQQPGNLVEMPRIEIVGNAQLTSTNQLRTQKERPLWQQKIPNPIHSYTIYIYYMLIYMALWEGVSIRCRICCAFDVFFVSTISALVIVVFAYKTCRIYIYIDIYTQISTYFGPFQLLSLPCGCRAFHRLQNPSWMRRRWKVVGGKGGSGGLLVRQGHWKLHETNGCDRLWVILSKLSSRFGWDSWCC